METNQDLLVDPTWNKRALPVLSLWSDPTVLKEGTLLLDLWLPGDSFRITNWTTKGITCFIADNATSTCDGILWRATAFLPLNRTSPKMDPRVNTSGLTPDSHLPLGNALANRWPQGHFTGSCVIATSSPLVQSTAIIKPHSKLTPLGWRILPQRY